MASPSPSAPTSTPTTPYHKFRRRGPQILPGWACEGEGALRDHDGAVLHETEWSALLLTIIKRNDVALLREYLARHPQLPPAETALHDPFWTAAAHGSTDALQVLLEHWAANPSVVKAPHERGFLLLNVACRHAQLGTARFLMDETRPWERIFGNVHAREDGADGNTAILSAVASYRGGLQHDDTEDLIRLLLLKGAHAADAIFPPSTSSDTEPPQPLHMVASLPTVDQPLDTVLSLAISGASADIIRCLIDGGADVNVKTIYLDTGGIFDGTFDVAWHVTPLHIGCMYANADGIQELFDHRGDGFDLRGAVSCRDNHGRLPLHWAAGGISANSNDDADVLRAIALLLAGNADTVNSPDAQGDTPLHYVVHSGGDLDTCYRVAKVLCDNGALASARGRDGQTPLHCLLSTYSRRPINTASVKLLLAHGADVGDADAGGNTVMHLVARSTQAAESVRFLLGEAGAKGAQVLRAVDAQGNTPLHVAAAQGHLLELGGKSAEDRIAAHDAVMTALTSSDRPTGENDTGLSLLDRPNQKGETPRQLREESRRRWRQEENARRSWAAGMGMTGGQGRGRGRGRGRGPVAPSQSDSPW